MESRSKNKKRGLQNSLAIWIMSYFVLFSGHLYAQQKDSEDYKNLVVIINNLEDHIQNNQDIL